MTEYAKAWQCIGCGMIEAPQTCIGVCEYRRAELVYAFDHEQAIAEVAAQVAAEARRRTEALVALARQLAFTTPREGEWERSYRAMQDQARRTLSALALPDAVNPRR